MFCPPSTYDYCVVYRTHNYQNGLLLCILVCKQHGISLYLKKSLLQLHLPLLDGYKIWLYSTLFHRFIYATRSQNFTALGRYNTVYNTYIRPLMTTYVLHCIREHSLKHMITQQLLGHTLPVTDHKLHLYVLHCDSKDPTTQHQPQANQYSR